ncbi:MAG: ATP phosphoribosyltransferase regulatory subunit [Acidobacteriota bacterium]
MRIRAGLPRGVTALLFDEARARRALEARLSQELEKRGFDEALLPVMDYFDPYSKLLLPQVQSELYRFVDREGELLALRGDFTPMLARLLRPRLADLELPLRLFYRGDVVRYQETRPGRLREDTQLGAELIGARGANDDETMIDLFLQLLTAEVQRIEDATPDLEIVLGVAGALDRLLEAQAHEHDVREVLRAVRARDREVTRSLDSTLLEIVEAGQPKDVERLGPAAAEDVGALLELAQRLEERYPQARVTVDLAEFADQVLDDGLLRRGAGSGYYDGVVFRAFLRGNAQPAGGGGRYDGLFGGAGSKVGAVGFFLGLDRILEQKSAGGGAR